MTDEQRSNFEAWLAALESGEYIQGKRALRNPDNTFCCLGVACDVARKRGVNLVWNTFEGGLELSGLGLAQETHFENEVLPGPLMSYFGLDSANPPITIRGNLADTSAFNDWVITFSEIAAALRAEYLTPNQ